MNEGQVLHSRHCDISHLAEFNALQQNRFQSGSEKTVIGYSKHNLQGNYEFLPKILKKQFKHDMERTETYPVGQKMNRNYENKKKLITTKETQGPILAEWEQLKMRNREKRNGPTVKGTVV